MVLATIVGLNIQGLKNIVAQEYIDADFRITDKEILYAMTTTHYFWHFPYEEAKRGIVSEHPILRYGGHSDIFIDMKDFIKAFPEIGLLIAYKMSKQILDDMPNGRLPDNTVIAGMPDGATWLAEKVAMFLGVENVKMAKFEDKIIIVQPISSNANVIIVEDIVTKGTATTQGITLISESQPEANIITNTYCVINRGGVKDVSVLISGAIVLKFVIVPLVQINAQDWPPEQCKLCEEFHSRAVKAKDTPISFISMILSGRPRESFSLEEQRIRASLILQRTVYAAGAANPNWEALLVFDHNYCDEVMSYMAANCLDNMPSVIAGIPCDYCQTSSAVFDNLKGISDQLRHVYMTKDLTFPAGEHIKGENVLVVCTELPKIGTLMGIAYEARRQGVAGIKFASVVRTQEQALDLEASAGDIFSLVTLADK